MKQLLRNRWVAAVLVLWVGSATANWGEWVYEEDIDPMNDKDTSLAILALQGEGYLVIRCDGSESYDIFISVGEYIGGDSAAVRYRVDSREAVDAGNWGLSTKGTSVFVPESKKSEILDELISGKRIIFQVEDYQGSKPYTEFPLAGSSAAIGQLSCI